MKNIFLFMLSAFFLLFFVACQTPQKDNKQLINTLRKSNMTILENNEITRYKLEEIYSLKENFKPLDNATYKICRKAKKLDKAFRDAISQSDTADIDYPKLFADYTAFCAFSKDILLAIQDSSQNNLLPDIKISKSKLDTFFKFFSDKSKTQKALSKDEFAKLSKDELKIYLLTFNLRLSSDVNSILSFIDDNIKSLNPSSFLLYKLILPSHSIISSTLLNEEYIAKTYLPSTHYQQPKNFQLYINGDSIPIPITEHKYIYKHEPTQIEKQSYAIKATYTELKNGKTIKTTNKLTYEVLPTQK